MTTVRFEQLRLATDGFTNPRKPDSPDLSTESITELAILIVRAGLWTPLLVVPSGLESGLMTYRVLAGSRRYHAIEMIREWCTAAEAHDLVDKALIDADITYTAIRNRAAELVNVPVTFIATGSELEDDTVALADNISRAQLRSVEIAETLVRLSDKGHTGVELARLIGKSEAYVSKKLVAYRGACPELIAVWAAQTISDDAVFELAGKSHDEQRKRLAGGEIPKRGTSNRPAIDVQKDVLLELEHKHPNIAPPSDPKLRAIYIAGVRDTLRWTTGKPSTSEFAQLVNEVTS